MAVKKEVVDFSFTDQVQACLQTFIIKPGAQGYLEIDWCFQWNSF